MERIYDRAPPSSKSELIGRTDSAEPDRESPLTPMKVEPVEPRAVVDKNAPKKSSQASGELVRVFLPLLAAPSRSFLLGSRKFFYAYFCVQYNLGNASL